LYAQDLSLLPVILQIFTKFFSLVRPFFNLQVRIETLMETVRGNFWKIFQLHRLDFASDFCGEEMEFRYQELIDTKFEVLMHNLAEEI